MHRRTRPLVVATSIAVVALAAAVPPMTFAARPAGSCGDPGLTADFNGDGRPDAAIGAPNATIDGKVNAGAVIVIHGGTSGLSLGTSTVITQATPGVTDVPDSGDQFGAAVAAADFDCDGYTDLAVGAPGDDLGEFTDLGLVNFLSGSPSGLVGEDHSYTLLDFLESSDIGSRIGSALVTLDSLDASLSGRGADGRPDLAVGAPGGTRHPGGKVIVLQGMFVDPGARSGASRLVVPDVSAGARAGAALAAGDLDDQPADDLVIGVPFANAGTTAEAGAIAIAMNGFEVPSVYRLGGLLPFTPGAADHLGAAVAVGDLDGDGYAEVAAGIPDRDADTLGDGAVLIIPSGAGGDGIVPDVAVLVAQSTSGVPGSAGAGDRFGGALAIGNLGKGGRADLAIGVPGDQINNADAAGSVVVLYGAGELFATSGNQRWSQASTDIADTAQAGDRFGAALIVAHRGRGGAADLTVGAPREDVGTVANAGAAHILYTNGLRGVEAANDQQLTRLSIANGTLAGKARLGTSVR